MKLKNGQRFLYTVGKYVEKCRGEERIPNLAGYLHYIGITAEEYKEIARAYRRETEIADAIFEDEALNTPPKRISPSVLSLYLKSRFGYGAADPTDRAAASEAKSYQILINGDGYADGE